MNVKRTVTDSPLFWDGMIVLLAAAGIAAFAWSLQSASLLIDIVGAAGLVGSLLVAWGSIVEPRLIVVNKKSIRISGLPSITIAVLGDQHYGPYKGRRYARATVDRVNALRPDLILLPGDFIFDHHADPSALEPLKHLRARLGIFAVLGNHDTGHMLNRKRGRFIPYRTPDRSADVIAMLRSIGIPVLRNEHRMLEHDGQTFAVAGSDHYLMDSMDLAATMNHIPDAAPVILLSHIPDVILLTETERASLIVSGHTHGGQIRLPFIGALYSVPDELGRAYDQGLFPLGNDRMLAITHGIGETMARARLFCPPEIMLMQINR